MIRFCKHDLQNSPFQQMEVLCKCRLHKSHGITIYLCSLTKVEYALRGMTQPLGVAEYQTTKMIEELKSELPSIDDLEKTLEE